LVNSERSNNKHKLSIPRIQSNDKYQFNNTFSDFNHFSFDYKNNLLSSRTNSKEKLFDTTCNNRQKIDIQSSLSHILSVSNINFVTREIKHKD
jgi:hypothetical protein